MLVLCLRDSPESSTQGTGPGVGSVSVETGSRSGRVSGLLEAAKASERESVAYVEPANTVTPRSVPAPVTGIEQMAASLQHDLAKLRELKLYGTATRVVNRSTYLTEDLLGRSFSMDEPYPQEILKRHGSYTVFTGPNGARIYSFPREDYPLFYEMLERKSQGYDDVLDDELVERIAVFAEQSLAMAGH